MLATFAFDVCYEVYCAAREAQEWKIATLNLESSGKYVWHPDRVPRLAEFVADFARAGERALGSGTRRDREKRPSRTKQVPRPQPLAGATDWPRNDDALVMSGRGEELYQLSQGNACDRREIPLGKLGAGSRYAQNDNARQRCTGREGLSACGSGQDGSAEEVPAASKEQAKMRHSEERSDEESLCRLGAGNESDRREILRCAQNDNARRGGLHASDRNGNPVGRASRLVMFRMFYLGGAEYQAARRHLGISEFTWADWAEEIRKCVGSEPWQTGRIFCLSATKRKTAG